MKNPIAAVKDAATSRKQYKEDCKAHPEIRYDRKSGVVAQATKSAWKEFELPPIVVVERRTMKVSNDVDFEFGISDRLVVGAYATGNMMKRNGTEKKMRVETYEPLAVVAEVAGQLQLIVSRKITKNAKKLQAFLEFYYAAFFDQAAGSFRLKGVCSDEAGNDVRSEAVSRLYAFTEAAANTGFHFTGFHVIGNLTIGGVAKQIRKDENERMMNIARLAARDAKRDRKLAKAQAEEVEDLEAIEQELDGSIVTEDILELSEEYDNLEETAEAQAKAVAEQAAKPAPVVDADPKDIKPVKQNGKQQKKAEANA